MSSKIKPILYSFWISSCSWRVRIGLQLKGIEYQYEAVDLLKGEQFKDEHGKVNFMKQVPTLKVGNDFISESLPILEYLEEMYPTPALLPADPIGRAKVRALAGMVASGIQPIQNLCVQKYVNAITGDPNSFAMPKHFITVGFQGLEQALQETTGKYSYGDEITLADLCLVPQTFNAMIRYDVDMSPFPTITKVYENLITHQAFIASHPQNQPDCP